MSDKIRQAKELFSSNYNCCQSTLTVFANEMGLDFQQALSMSAGIGGGMRMAKTCGAVAGAYMALGLYSGKQIDKPELIKENTYKLMKVFNDGFIGLHDHTDCKELLGVDISTEKGLESAKSQELFVKKCPIYVADAVGLLEKMLKIE